MTDHELLLLAAKAAEITTEKDGDATFFYNEFGDVWDPLNDDGDALRLAVGLDLVVCASMRLGRQVAAPMNKGSIPRNAEKWSNGTVGGFYESDPFAATRRAIVRAAAEIGKAMP